MNDLNSIPKVSIVMPAYKSASTLFRSIQCVVKQTFRNWELWVLMDGASTEESSIVNEWCNKDQRIRPVMSLKHRGVVRMRNLGLRLSRGEWIAFCDADDYWLPNKLQLQLNLANKKDCEIVFSNFYFLYPGTPLKKRFVRNKSEVTLSTLYRVNGIPMSTSMIKRSAIITLFKELPNQHIHEDYLFWLDNFKDKDHMRAFGLKQATAYITIPSNSRSSNIIQSILSHGYVLKWVGLSPFSIIQNMIFYLFLALKKRYEEKPITCDLTVDLE